MARSYDISKQVVWRAYRRVKANKGAAGIDDDNGNIETVFCRCESKRCVEYFGNVGQTNPCGHREDSSADSHCGSEPYCLRKSGKESPG